MTGQYLPGAAWRPVSYRAEAGTFAHPPIGYIVHVQVGLGSPWGTFQNAHSPDRKFSNGWVAKDGHSEQYAELTCKPWAQRDGNPLYLAFETEGFPGEPLTPAQIDTLARWHNAIGAPDLITDTPGAPGSGTHVMGGAAYGGHTCPGPGPRAAQRANIITRARQIRGNLSPIPAVFTHPTTPAKAAKIVLAVDGVFGPQSRMRLQQWAGAKADSILGPLSWRAIQAKVGGLTVDGNPGRLTWRRIQTVTGARVDGAPGPDTYRHLQTYLNGH